MRSKSLSKGLGTCAVLFLLLACGKAEEVANDLNLPGNWLMTESHHANAVEKVVENESMVLTFKDGKAAFAPTDSVKGRAVYATLSECTAGPRPYRTENDQIVFEAVGKCPEKRVKVNRLNRDRLEITDLENPDIIRTFVRIDNHRYDVLVKPGDQRL